MHRGIDTVPRLWPGEHITLPNGSGQDVQVMVRPRPIQSELPFWLTAAGSPETFAAAGRVGANLLTHLLGQTAEQLAAKITAYREARRAAGHACPGHVTLMLHTYVH